MLPVVLNGVKTHALVDSGASVCLLSKSVYEQMSTTRHRLIAGGKVIRGVGNNTLATIGEMNVDVQVAGKEWPMKMAVSSEKEPVGCYLGMNFFQTHGCEFSVLKGTFRIGGKEIKLVPESRVDVCARIRAERDVTIPPHSEMIVTGKPEALHRRMRAELAIVEPSRMVKSLEEVGLYTGATVVASASEHVPIPLINTSAETQVVRKGTTLAMMRPVTNVERADSSGQTEKSEKVRCSGTASSRGEELPPHMQPLLEGLAKDVTPEQRQ